MKGVHARKAVMFIVAALAVTAISSTFVLINNNTKAIETIAEIIDLENENDVDILVNYKNDSISYGDTLYIAHIKNAKIADDIADRKDIWKPLPLDQNMVYFLKSMSLEDVCLEAKYDFVMIDKALNGKNGYFYIDNLFLNATPIMDVIDGYSLNDSIPSFKWAVYDVETSNLYYIEYID
jgi:hypothetical protein